MSYTAFRNYPNILISTSRIVTLSVGLFIVGLLPGMICIGALTLYEGPNIIRFIAAIVCLMGALYCIFLAIKCLYVDKVQFQFTNTGIKYKKIAEPFDEYKQNVGIRFYFTQTFCFLDYESILEAGIKKKYGGRIIYVLCKSGEQIYIPILLDHFRDIEELVKLINQRVKQETHYSVPKEFEI